MDNTVYLSLELKLIKTLNNKNQDSHYMPSLSYKVSDKVTFVHIFRKLLKLDFE